MKIDKGFWKVYLKSGYVIEDRSINKIEQDGDNYELMACKMTTKQSLENIIPYLLTIKKTVHEVEQETVYLIPQSSVNYAEWVTNE